MTAADILSICRENKGFTQKRLSEMTGIAIPNISQMENGRRKIGKMNAKKLTDALDCDAADFFMYL
ncbi:MAG: helix-turn-helix transcriptional regulator [Treponema sp.]|nr:helix-turn-helix transcriptional regulator [Treponema sp.]